jgi:hypothetical protein
LNKRFLLIFYIISSHHSLASKSYETKFISISIKPRHKSGLQRVDRDSEKELE